MDGNSRQWGSERESPVDRILAEALADADLTITYRRPGAHWLPCGCSAMASNHKYLCPATPIFAQLWAEVGDPGMHTAFLQLQARTHWPPPVRDRRDLSFTIDTPGP